MKTSFLLILAVLVSSCHPNSSRTVTVTFRVELKSHVRADRVVVCGNTEMLGNWKARGIQATMLSDTIAEAVLVCREGEDLEFKVHAGSWWMEAVDSRGQLFQKFRLHAARDTVVSLPVYGWSHHVIDGRTVLSAAQFTSGRPVVRLDECWKYHSGDSAIWALDTYNDSAWTQSNSIMNWLNDRGRVFEGVGWFRFRMRVDTSLWHSTLAVLISQLGASEIYYNGKLLNTVGDIGSISGSYKPLQNRSWKSLTIDPQPDQIIAVRYANREGREQLKLGFAPGFLIFVTDVNTIFEQVLDETRANAAKQMVFTCIPLILCLLHLFLYAFFPVRKHNLFYAFSMLGFAGITYFSYQRGVIVDPATIILFYKLGSVSMPVAVLFGLLTGYSIGGETLPKRWWGFLALCVAVGAIDMYDPLRYSATANYLLFGVTIIDLIYSLSTSRGQRSQRGGAIVITGFVVLILIVVVQILVDYGVIAPPFGERQVYVYGMLAFIIAMSLYLSNSIAGDNKDLVVQLNTVQHLSRNAIEQEKVAARLELDRRLLEVEHERKSRELEAARDLQLSLLPKDLPVLDHLDIGCLMKTATEVGGDYYDFFTGADGTLTTVIGDATGHGLKAGMMVFLNKGLFNMLASREDLVTIMKEANRAIKNMNLNQLTMCMSIVRISGGTLEYSSAGIPPLLIYRKKTCTVEQLLLKAMPLGAFRDFPYGKLETKVGRGDIILMMSDGLPELFNASGDNFGIEQVSRALTEAGDGSAEEMAKSIYAASMAWAGGRPLRDDLTMVVIKLLD
jgi:serine phosphatase RsbU (regulator of sigma subunit)